MTRYEPVPMAPSHKPVWRRLRRYCSCGLIWRTCPDRYPRPAVGRMPEPAWKTAPTSPYPTVLHGRGPLGMTLGQQMRARGRQWLR